MTTYPGMTFTNMHGIEIDINEDVSLRDALNALEIATKAKYLASGAEACACGEENYRKAKEAHYEAQVVWYYRRAEAQAAFYRETGRWPMVMRDLHVC